MSDNKKSDVTRVTLEYTAPHSTVSYSRLGVTLSFETSSENFDKDIKQKGVTLLNIRTWMENLIMSKG